MMGMLLTHTPLLYYVQSLWRDEAFSVLAAAHPLSFIVTRLGFEPPVYYTLLHFWMLAFGDGEVSVRTLSVIGFLLATAVVIEWADTLYRKHWLAWYLPLFFFLNPMLLYYAFEVRTYAWYTFFATLTLFAYTTKRWRLFMAGAILGFYTHVYLLPYIGVLFLHWAWTNRTALGKHLTKPLSVPGAAAFFVTVAAMIPWLVKIFGELGRMKNSWYFPVDLQLVKSVLGNMFLGYEGTPWYGWKYTAVLSLVIALLSAYAFTDKRRRKQTVPFALFGFVPLAVIVIISFVKPLFVNRYLIPTTVAEVFVLVAALAAIRNKMLQKAAAVLLMVFVLAFNWWYPPHHAKPKFREAFEQINAVAKPDDIFLAANPINYLETLYYAKNRSKVYLYNPTNGVFPWYIGDALITQDRMLRDYPDYPARAMLVHPDTTYEIVYRIPL